MKHPWKTLPRKTHLLLLPQTLPNKHPDLIPKLPPPTVGGRGVPPALQVTASTQEAISAAKAAGLEPTEWAKVRGQWKNKERRSVSGVSRASQVSFGLFRMLCCFFLGVEGSWWIAGHALVVLFLVRELVE